jgi:hypothetical protein
VKEVIKVSKVAKWLRVRLLLGLVPVLLCATLAACDSPAAGEPPSETGSVEGEANNPASVTLTEEETALIQIFEAAMLSESDLPEGYTWEEQKSISAGWYSVTYTSRGSSAEKITVHAYLTVAREYDTMTNEEYFIYENEEMLANDSYAFDGLPLAYIILSDTSIYDDEETTAMLVFLKNGLYEGGITFKGRDLDYSYCKEEAIRLGTLIWERLAD